MAALLTHQHSPFPSSGNTLTRDGSPLHSRLGLDLMLGCNNLGYTFPGFGAVVGQGVDTRNDSLDGPGERFAVQVPVVLPADGVRFCWALGIAARNDSSEDMLLEGVTLYVSPGPYKGPSTDSAPASTVFDPTAMGAPYMTDGATLSETVPPDGDDHYYFIDRSDGVAGLWLPFRGETDGGLINANLIFTTTGYTQEDEVNLKVFFQDFSFWVNPE